jgi:uncharacterized protein YacL
MDNIHFENIIKSFFLGLFIGVILQFYDRSDVRFEYQALRVLASGSIGFIIGFITEWLTSILPIHLANARMYFFINNFIALAVTAIIMAATFVMFTSSEAMNAEEITPIILIVLGIVCLANLFDYLMYRRAQNKLRTFKALIEDEEA